MAPPPPPPPPPHGAPPTPPPLWAHPDGSERLIHPLRQIIPAQAEVGRAEGHVIAHRRHEELVVGVLEDHPHAAPNLGDRVIGDLTTTDAHGPRGGPQDRIEVKDQGGLPSAIGPEQGNPLARVNV